MARPGCGAVLVVLRPGYGTCSTTRLVIVVVPVAPAVVLEGRIQVLLLVHKRTHCTASAALACHWHHGQCQWQHGATVTRTNHWHTHTNRDAGNQTWQSLRKRNLTQARNCPGQCPAPAAGRTRQRSHRLLDSNHCQCQCIIMMMAQAYMSADRIVGIDTFCTHRYNLVCLSGLPALKPSTELN